MGGGRGGAMYSPWNADGLNFRKVPDYEVNSDYYRGKVKSIYEREPMFSEFVRYCPKNVAKRNFCVFAKIIRTIILWKFNILLSLQKDAIVNTEHWTLGLGGRREGGGEKNKNRNCFFFRWTKIWVNKQKTIKKRENVFAIATPWFIIGYISREKIPFYKTNLSLSRDSPKNVSSDFFF